MNGTNVQSFQRRLKPSSEGARIAVIPLAGIYRAVPILGAAEYPLPTLNTSTQALANVALKRD
jgi:hypothetical protein